MKFSDDELLDFDLMELGGFRQAPRGLLHEHGDAYREHLAVAIHLVGWADRTEQMGVQTQAPGDYLKGFVEALREVSVRLRQGDYLPGGIAYDDMTGKG